MLVKSISAKEVTVILKCNYGKKFKTIVKHVVSNSHFTIGLGSTMMMWKMLHFIAILWDSSEIKETKEFVSSGDLVFIHYGYAAKWKDTSRKTIAFCKHESSSLHKQELFIVFHEP